MSADETAHCLAALECYKTATGGPINGKWRYKSHLVFPWINEMMRLPQILVAVEDLLGPEVMVRSSHLYPKEPGDGQFISWHQDSAHWGLDSNQIVTVWVALTEASEENGGMRILPGSHIGGIAPHRDTWDPNNILTRGQTIDAEIDETRAVWTTLQPGEGSLHHIGMWHASKPNEADKRRVDTDFAILLRGEYRSMPWQNISALPTSKAKSI